MKVFWKGVITGVTVTLLLVFLITAFRFFWEKDRKIFEAMETQHEIELLQTDIGSRPADEFLEDAAIRGAADDAAGEFRRKRDEAIRAIRRSRIAK
jgi:hypothetical protein